jgi:hypothetical protein
LPVVAGWLHYKGPREKLGGFDARGQMHVVR